MPKRKPIPTPEAEYDRGRAVGIEDQVVKVDDKTPHGRIIEPTPEPSADMVDTETAYGRTVRAPSSFRVFTTAALLALLLGAAAAAAHAGSLAPNLGDPQPPKDQPKPFAILHVEEMQIFNEYEVWQIWAGELPPDTHSVTLVIDGQCDDWTSAQQTGLVAILDWSDNGTDWYRCSTYPYAVRTFDGHPRKDAHQTTPCAPFARITAYMLGCRSAAVRPRLILGR